MTFITEYSLHRIANTDRLMAHCLAWIMLRSRASAPWDVSQWITDVTSKSQLNVVNETVNVSV